MGKMAASKMKGQHLNDAKSYTRKDINETINPDLSGCDFNFGDIAWVRTGSYSWWPAQVMDEKSVGPNGKARKKAEGKVLIRLYGAYKYLYIDPVRNNEEFENTMKQNNSCIREMLEKSLEEDLSRIKSRRKTKGNPPPSKEHMTAGVSTDAEMRDKIERIEETNLVACVEASSIKDKERRTNCTEEIEKARDVSSKIKNPKQHYIRKQRLRQKDRGGTLGDMKLEEEDARGINCTKDLDKASDIDHGDKKLKKNINRKQPVTGKSRDGTLENLDMDEVKEPQVKEKTGREVRQNQDRKRKTKQEDATKLEQDGVKERKVKEKAIHVTSKQLVGKKRKLTEKTQPEVLKCNSETQDSEQKSKAEDVTKHDKPDVHRSGKHAQVGDASARRMKVMQSLALIAPSGSPFRKNGHVNAASCKS